ncbi:hypothetical protein WICMUC_004081 [Wickerhamomyces mucosus]|uniref:C2H2-type domain-containing protein n=1 Tax=Wickerhamomyces mucosus TaxID=1378264 RepID=A0A9P8TBP2_9ASCO|nr:hypothetical protein WICMUC_004081 [Wickerhamomyces mucosus]
MASLIFPTLRRTLTDVMEDELYHLPNQNQTQQIHQQQQQQQQVQHFEQTISSPMLSSNTTRLYRNPSALNSEEMLTIPDNNHIQQISRISSHDLYYDVPEPINSSAFNEYADPNVTTTNDSTFPIDQHFPYTFNLNEDSQEIEVPKLVKFNEDLNLEYFNNEEYGKFMVFNNSPDMIPEQIEDEDISDDEDGPFLDHEDIDKLSLNYSNSNTITNNNSNNINNIMNNDNNMHISQNKEIHNHNHKHNHEHIHIVNNNSNIDDLGSDIDKMSLDSADDSMDEMPIFKEEIPSSPPAKKSRTSSFVKPDVKIDIKTEGLENNIHQCSLINPATKKPCLKIFSRPYDLIRHQETLHAPSKKIYRCVVCNELSGGKSKKSFSRCDALSRHIKIKHGLTGSAVDEAMKYAKDNVEYIEYD